MRLTQNFIDGFTAKKIPHGKPFVEKHHDNPRELSIRFGKRKKTFYVTIPANENRGRKRIALGEIKLSDAVKKSLEILRQEEFIESDYSNFSLKRYIEEVYLRNDDPDKYRIALNRINREYPLFKLEISKIKSFHVKDWIKERKSSYVTRGYIKNGEKFTLKTDKQVSFSSIKREYNTVRAALSYAVEREHIKTNPASKIKISGEDKVTRKPIPEIIYKGYQKMIGTLPNSHLKVYLAVLLYTGARPNEVMHIKKSNVDLLNHRIIVPAAYTKTSITRYLIMPDDLMSILFDFINSSTHQNTKDIDEGWLFFNPNTKRRFGDFNSAYKRAVKSANLPYYSQYHFRHTFASKLAKKGVDIVTIMNLLGHTNIKTTQDYLKSLDESDVEAVNILAEDIDIW